MASAIVPFVFALVGALIYALSANPKVEKLGLIGFFCGLFWLVQELGTKTWHF